MNPPFSLFLGEEKEKTGRSRSKREKDAPAGASQVRWNPTVPTNENEEDHTDLACLSFRCRCCGGRWGTVRLTFYNLAARCIYRQNEQSGRSTIYSGHRRATAAVDAESSQRGLLVLNSTTRQLAQHLTALFSLWTVNGPFLFSLAREKRNGGFKPPSHGNG